jgi:nicotinamidase-related amidase
MPTISPKMIFWEADAQADFMVPGGKLYVAGAEKIISKVDRLVEACRQRPCLSPLFG